MMEVQDNMFKIDTDSKIPLYHQIKQNIRQLIDEGLLNSGDSLPSERELAVHYGVNRLTVRRAIGELVDEGILKRKRGVGTFISDPKLTQNMKRVNGFNERVQETGRIPSDKIISFEELIAPINIARKFSVQSDESVYKLVRLRYVDGEPVMIQTAWLLKKQYPALDQYDLSVYGLYQVLSEKYNSFPVESDETLEPVILTEYEQQMLESRPDTPGLFVESVTKDQNGKIAEFSTSIVRGDRCRYYFHISRATGNE